MNSELWKWVNCHFCGNRMLKYVGVVSLSRHLWHRTRIFGQLGEFGSVQHFTAALLQWRLLWGARNESAEDTHRGEELLPCPHSLYLLTHTHANTHIHAARIRHMEKTFNLG